MPPGNCLKGKSKMSRKMKPRKMLYLQGLGSGGRGTRTPMRLRAAVFKTAALPVRSSPPGINL